MLMRRYFVQTLRIAAVAAAVIAGFLYWADPFAILHYNRQNYYKVEDYLRISKPYWAAGEWDAAVIGSSVSLRGLKPSVVEQHYPGIGRVFNFGIYGVRSYELRRYSDHMMAVAPVRRILLEARPFVLGEVRAPPQFSESRMAVARDGKAQPFWRYSDLHRAVFSAAAVERAVKNIFSVRAPRRHRSDGEARYLLSRSYRHDGHYKAMVMSTKRTTTLRVKTTSTHLKDLRHILSSACSKDVSVDVFFPPVHAYFLESIYRNHEANLDSAKQSIVKVVDDAARRCRGQARFAVWDFMTFNSIALEPLSSEKRRYNFDDTAHFTKRVGASMAAIMAAGVRDPTGFGVQLRPGNVTRHLAQQRIAREKWHLAQPDAIALYEELKQRSD